MGQRVALRTTLAASIPSTAATCAAGGVEAFIRAIEADLIQALQMLQRLCNAPDVEMRRKDLVLTESRGPMRPPQYEAQWIATL